MSVFNQNDSENCKTRVCSTNLHCAQVGDWRTDHPIFVGKRYVAEAISDDPGTRNATRPVFILDSRTTNGSDMIGEAVAAYASLSMLFNKINPSLSVALEGDAFAMYDLMQTMPNTKYSDADPETYRVCICSALLPL